MLILGCPTGCAGPGPLLLPREPLEIQRLTDGSIQRWYATTTPGRGDYYEQLSPQGRIVAIGYLEGNGCQRQVIKLDEIPPAERRDLVLLLDSVPYQLADEFWKKGLFRLFPEPTRTIAPFPALTDLSFAEFFNCSPMTAPQAQSYNGFILTYGYGVYAVGGDAGWMHYVKRYLPFALNPEAYLKPYPWLGNDLRMFENVFLNSRRPMTVCYSLCTSCVGARYDREGMERALTDVDQLTRYLIFKTRGRARITMLSDHGLAFFPQGGRRILLREEFPRLGHPSGIMLCGKESVVVPEFGLVSVASVYTHAPADVARDALQIAGIELSAYMDGDTVVVRRADGIARIHRKGDAFSYKPERGDPLEILPILQRLADQGQVSPEGFVQDRVLFEATVNATYPDAVARLWRSFHGLVKRTPQVYLSEADGYYSGDSTMNANITMRGIHGNLRKQSSDGFAVTMAGDLPPVHRQIDLRKDLARLGVMVPGKGDFAVSAEQDPSSQGR